MQLKLLNAIEYNVKSWIKYENRVDSSIKFFDIWTKSVLFI